MDFALESLVPNERGARFPRGINPFPFSESHPRLPVLGAFYYTEDLCFSWVLYYIPAHKQLRIRVSCLRRDKSKAKKAKTAKISKLHVW